MNPEELKALRELLGDEFTLKEVEEMAQQDPGLLASALRLGEGFRAARTDIPALPPGFTQRVLAALPQASPWRQTLRGLWSFRSLSWVAAAAALGGIAYLASPYLHLSQAPIAQLHEGTEQEATVPRRRVQFKTRPTQAQNVAVLGDFNQWVPWPLERQADGSFAGVWELPEGHYAYSYLVDGDRWVLDEAALQVEDCFGHKNSLLSL